MTFDSIIEARSIGDWLFIRWTVPGLFKKRFVKAFRKAETMVRELGLRGWYCGSEKEHTTMHKLIQKVGAIPYDEHDNQILFRKEMPCAKTE